MQTRLAFMLLFVAVPGWTAEAAPPAPLRAKYSIDLPAPVASTPDKPGDSLDVDKLSVRSDGKSIVFTATLKKDPTTTVGAEALRLYVDSDNNPATGSDTDVLGSPKPQGFEFAGKLVVCVQYDNKGDACAGGLKGPAVVSRDSGISVEHYKDTSWMHSEEIVGMMASMIHPDRKVAQRQPVVGKTIAGSLDYAVLGVKSGQTVRLMMRKLGVGPSSENLFPVVLLTLE